MSIIITLRFISVAALLFLLSCASCRGTDVAVDAQDDSSAAQIEKASIISPKARGFLSEFKSLLDTQDQARIEAETQKKIEADERIIQISVSQTLDELLALDPEKQAQRLDELVKDLADLGEPAYKAVREQLAADRPAHQVALLLRAIGAFKVKGVGQEFYQYALRAKDSRLREAALSQLARSADRRALASKAVEDLRSMDTSQADASSQQDRIVRVAALGAVGGAQAIDALTDVLRSSDSIDVKKAAISALKEIGGDDVTAALKEIFQSSDELRVFAAQALGSMGKESSHEEMLLSFGEILASAESPEALRLAAVEGLGADNGPLARRILFQLLRDTRQSRAIHELTVNIFLRGSVMTSAELTAATNIFEQTPIDYLPQMMQPMLAKSGDAAAEIISTRYAAYSQLKKIHAIRSLERIHSDRAFEVLMDKVLMEKDPAARSEILTAMKRFDGETAAKATASILKQVARTTTNTPEFTAALSFLGEKSPQDAAAIAIDQLYTDMGNRERAQACIEILKKFGSSEQKGSLLAYKVQAGIPDLDPQIDDAISNIEARERR